MAEKMLTVLYMTVLRIPAAAVTLSTGETVVVSNGKFQDASFAALVSYKLTFAELEAKIIELTNR